MLFFSATSQAIQAVNTQQSFSAGAINIVIFNVF